MLPIFPSAYIDDSLLTAVFVGVLLLWWLAERFGWPTTGLVVPGYLGAILAIRPDAALVVAAEAIITYVVADVLGRRLRRWVPVDITFGRDRFFLIILASILVRLGVEVWPGPLFLADLGLDRADGWHSIGLVLVPLTANALWKPGLRAGVPLVGLPVIAVYLLLRFVLLPFTNLSLVTLELTYADLEWSFLGSPRVYLLLVIGSFIASHATVRFGWDFGGIIVCGLLAIAWLSPLTVLATLAEVLLIVFIVRTLVAVPPLKTANLSGLRPIVLAFTVSYAVKLCISLVGQGLWPSFTTVDLFGFGYLLPALLATRVWRHGQIARVLVPTVLVSFLGFSVGTSVGVVLSVLSPDPVERRINPDQRPAGPGWAVAIESIAHSGRPIRVNLRDEVAVAVAVGADGREYIGRALRVLQYPDGLVLDPGDTGLSTVLWREGGSDEVEVWVEEPWRAGLAEAALEVARRLDARTVVFGPGTYLTGVHRRGAERVWVEVGDEAVWRGPLDRQSALAGLVDAAEAGEGEVQLVLDRAALGHAALRSVVGQTTGRSAAERLEYGAAERGLVVPALMATDDPRWLAVSAAWGRRYGIDVYQDGAIVRLDGPEVGPYAVDVDVFAVQGDLAVEVRQPIDELVQVGRAWAQAGDARALLRLADEDATELSRVWWRALAREKPGRDGVVIDRLWYDDLVGAEAVVFDGRAVSPVHDPSRAAERAVALVNDAGFVAAYADASLPRARFYDGGDRRRVAVEPFGGHLATVWVGQGLRDVYAGVGPGSPASLALAGAEVPVEPLELEALLVGEPVRSDAFDEVWSALARYSRTRHPGALERAVHLAGEGATVRGTLHEPSGRVLVVVERDGLIGVAPLGFGGRAVHVGDWTLPAVWSRP